MLRRLHAARRLGGLAAALPRAAEEQLDALRAACEGVASLAAAARASQGEGSCHAAAARALGASRPFAAAGGARTELAEPPAARIVRSRHSGVHGEKTASGRPKPDVSTVARLVQLGWFATAEDAETVLTVRKTDSRYAFETAGPAIDWLRETLGEGVHHVSGRCCAAQAVFKFPRIITYTTATLQHGWESVLRPLDAGGLGLSHDVARQRVASFPPVLAASKEFLQHRVTFLESLGVRDGRVAVARLFQLLNCSDERLRAGAELLHSHGVGHLVSAHPQLLWLSHVSVSRKLDFLSTVVGLHSDDIKSPYLTYSLEERLRPRHFFALQNGAYVRYTFCTLMVCSDARFLKAVYDLNDLASNAEVGAYAATVASPEFKAFMDEQERAIRARRPRPRET